MRDNMVSQLATEQMVQTLAVPEMTVNSRYAHLSRLRTDAVGLLGLLRNNYAERSPAMFTQRGLLHGETFKIGDSEFTYDERVTLLDTKPGLPVSYSTFYRYMTKLDPVNVDFNFGRSSFENPGRCHVAAPDFLAVLVLAEMKPLREWLKLDRITGALGMSSRERDALEAVLTQYSGGELDFDYIHRDLAFELIHYFHDDLSRGYSAKIIDLDERRKVRENARRDKLVLENMDLVERIAWGIAKKVPSHIKVEDMQSAGTIGLIDAAMKYVPGRASFRQYAQFRIRGQIRDYLRREDHLSQPTRRSASSIHKAIQSLEQSETTVNDDTIAEELGWGVDTVRKVRKQMEIHNVSMDDLEGVDHTGILTDKKALHHIECSEARVFLTRSLCRLSDRERQVIRLYHFHDINLADIGKVLGVTEARVSQIRRKALDTLSEFAEEQSLSLTDFFSD